MKGTVQRFRSVEEMSAAPIIVSPVDGFERFARHCARYFKLAPPRYPRGVFRFRTIEEAQDARAAVARARLRRE